MVARQEQHEVEVARGPADTAISLGLAALIIGSWLAANIYGVMFHEIEWRSWPATLALLALATWLNVGIFIVAHDGMHNALVPGRPSLNRAISTLCLTLYAGLSFERVNTNHHRHHRHVGTAEDPDFLDAAPHRFWPWFLRFMSGYLTPFRLLFFPVVIQIYVMGLGANVANVLLLWCLPALLAALQLFWFGTYLPHKPSAQPFADSHRSRSNDYPWLVSLLTCFHFGYHREHHLYPKLPWWRLPAMRSHRRRQISP